MIFHWTHLYLCQAASSHVLPANTIWSHVEPLYLKPHLMNPPVVSMVTMAHHQKDHRDHQQQYGGEGPGAWVQGHWTRNLHTFCSWCLCERIPRIKYISKCEYANKSTRDNFPCNIDNRRHYFYWQQCLNAHTSWGQRSPWHQASMLPQLGLAYVTERVCECRTHTKRKLAEKMLSQEG